MINMKKTEKSIKYLLKRLNKKYADKDIDVYGYDEEWHNNQTVYIWELSIDDEDDWEVSVAYWEKASGCIVKGENCYQGYEENRKDAFKLVCDYIDNCNTSKYKHNLYYTYRR